MKITKITPAFPEDHDDVVQEVVDALHKEFDDSRFNVDGMTVTHRPRAGVMIKMGQVRLKSAKDYCGNHPGGCEFPGLGPDRKAKFLEGADWVEFNDRVNDVLDRLCINAHVENSLLIIRKVDLGRRMLYGQASFGRNAQWNKDEHYKDYEDHCGDDPSKTEMSEFPDGTPGQYLRNGETYSVVG
jgi:hypothetical protein